METSSDAGAVPPAFGARKNRRNVAITLISPWRSAAVTTAICVAGKRAPRASVQGIARRFQSRFEVTLVLGLKFGLSSNEVELSRHIALARRSGCW